MPRTSRYAASPHLSVSPARPSTGSMLELARTAWAMVSLALVAVFVWALMVLPERVPQKLDAAWSVTE